MKKDDLQQLRRARKLFSDRQFADLNEFLFARLQSGDPLSKTDLGRLLNIWPSKLTTLLNPRSYRVSGLDDALIDRIAVLLNRTTDYVRDFYRRAA